MAAVQGLQGTPALRLRDGESKAQTHSPYFSAFLQVPSIDNGERTSLKGELACLKSISEAHLHCLQKESTGNTQARGILLGKSKRGSSGARCDGCKTVTGIQGQSGQVLG